MLPLLFILIITGLGIFITYYLSNDISWFTYYIGGVIGLLVSSLILEIWTKQKRKQHDK